MNVAEGRSVERHIVYGGYSDISEYDVRILVMGGLVTTGITLWGSIISFQGGRSSAAQNSITTSMFSAVAFLSFLVVFNYFLFHRQYIKENGMSEETMYHIMVLHRSVVVLGIFPFLVPMLGIIITALTSKQEDKVFGSMQAIDYIQLVLLILLLFALTFTHPLPSFIKMLNEKHSKTEIATKNFNADVYKTVILGCPVARHDTQDQTPKTRSHHSDRGTVLHAGPSR